MSTAAPIRVLELRSVWGTGGGPEKTILLGAAHSNPSRLAITVCYLRDVRDSVFGIHERAAALGVDYVELPERHSLDPSVWRRLVDLVKTKRVDIVHSHDYKTDLLAWMLLRMKGVNVVSTAHGWTGHSWKEQRLYYPANKRLLTRMPRVLAVSSEIRQELLRRGAHSDRVTVLLNGIDHRQFWRDASAVARSRERFDVEPGTTVLGSVGRLEPQKRFDLLIDAFARVHGTRPDLRLLIAGDGSLREDLQALIARRNLARVCGLLGHEQDIPAFHHAIDIFIQASDYEGTPNAVLEAMAFERPIIATDAGGTAEVCRPDVDGLIIPAGDSQAIADSIERVLRDPNGASSRAAAARARVEADLSFERRQACLEDIYTAMERRR